MNINDLMNTPADKLTNLIAKQKYQGVCAEVCFFLQKQNVMIDGKRTPDEEIVTQAVFCFELLSPAGAILVIDSRGLSVLDANGRPKSITSDQTNIGKFLAAWSGGKKGNDMTSWLGTFGSLKGRQVIVDVGHEESANGKAVYAVINSVSELTELPGQKINRLEISKDYVPLVERNRDFFTETPDGWMRTFEKKKKEGEDSEAPEHSREEMKVALGAQSPTSPKKSSKAASDAPLRDKDIPF